LTPVAPFGPNALSDKSNFFILAPLFSNPFDKWSSAGGISSNKRPLKQSPHKQF